MHKGVILVDSAEDAASCQASLSALQALFDGELEMGMSVDPEQLTLDALRDVRLVVTHDNVMLQGTSDAFASALIAYVAGGGGWLAIHNGTIVDNANGLTTLLGASMVHELPEQEYEFIITTPEHPVMQGVDPFKLRTSAYQYAFSTIKPGPRQEKRALLFEYLHNMTVGTGAWAQQYCLGRVVGCALGHDLTHSDCSMYQKIIRQSGLWAAGMLS